MRNRTVDRRKGRHRAGIRRRGGLRAAVVTGLLAAAAFAVPAQPASAACPDGGYPGPSGQRVKSPTSDAVFLIDPAGYKRPIPDPTTYNQFFRGWEGITTTSETNCYWTGSTIELGFDYLAKTSSGAYYFVDSTGSTQVARWIPSVAIYDKYYFSWGTPQLVSQQFIDDHRGANWV